MRYFFKYEKSYASVPVCNEIGKSQTRRFPGDILPFQSSG
jgi:hypothetical protein